MDTAQRKSDLLSNLIVIALAHTVHFDITVEEFLGAAMLIGAYALLILAHHRRSPSTPWLYYCPVMLVGLALTQWENTLWGFQMAWFLVLLSLAATLFILDRITMTWLAFVAAILLAIIGSYSSLQGLLIWPTGLVLLYYRRRDFALFISWVAAGMVVTIWYLHHFPHSQLAGPSQHYALTHPFVSFTFVLFQIGDIVGINLRPVGLALQPGASGNAAVLLLGVVIFMVAVLAVVTLGVRRMDQSGGPIGVALMVYGFLFAVVVALGRISQGYYSAS